MYYRKPKPMERKFKYPLIGMNLFLFFLAIV